MYLHAVDMCQKYISLLTTRRVEMVQRQRVQAVRWAHFDFFSWDVVSSYYPTYQTGNLSSSKPLRVSGIDIIEEIVMASMLLVTLNYNLALVSINLGRVNSVQDILVGNVQCVKPLIYLQWVRTTNGIPTIFRETSHTFMLSVYHRTLFLLQSFIEKLQVSSTTPSLRQAQALWCSSRHAFKAACLMKLTIESWKKDPVLVRICIDMCRSLIGISQAIAADCEKKAFAKFKKDISKSMKFISTQGPVYDTRLVVDIVHYELHMLRLCRYYLLSYPNIYNGSDLSRSLSEEYDQCLDFLMRQEMHHLESTMLEFLPEKVENAMVFLRTLEPLSIYDRLLAKPNRFIEELLPQPPDTRRR